MARRGSRLCAPSSPAPYPPFPSARCKLFHVLICFFFHGGSLFFFAASGGVCARCHRRAARSTTVWILCGRVGVSFYFFFFIFFLFSPLRRVFVHSCRAMGWSRYPFCARRGWPLACTKCVKPVRSSRPFSLLCIVIFIDIFFCFSSHFGCEFFFFWFFWLRGGCVDPLSFCFVFFPSYPLCVPASPRHPPACLPVLLEH